MMTQETMTWAGHVACTRENKHCIQTEGKRPRGTPWLRGEDNIKTDFNMLHLPCTDQIQPVHHTDYNTSPKPWTGTDHITVLVTNPQTPNSFNSPDL